MIILKLLSGEFDIGTTANNCANASLVRVLNTGARAKANVAYSNGVVYANVTISNTESVIIAKSPTDTIIGASMVAVPVAYRS